MRMPTLLPIGEGCMSGEAIDTRARDDASDGKEGERDGHV
jgi:hypothetical protein